MLRCGDKIGIVCCSNGQKHTYKEKINQLESTLEVIGLHPVFSDCIYEKNDVFSGTAKERADALMRFYKDDEIKGIFDIPDQGTMTMLEKAETIKEALSKAKGDSNFDYVDKMGNENSNGNALFFVVQEWLNG